MKLKTGVSLVGLQLPMRRALVAFDRTFKGYGAEFTVTATLNGAHSAGSYHYYGFAIDARKNNPASGLPLIPAERQQAFLSDLQEALGPDYYLLDEGDHYHCHYRKAYEFMGLKHWSTLT